MRATPLNLALDLPGKPSTRRRRSRGAPIRHLNITAMMDVTFQLILFFVLTANYGLSDAVIPSDLPKGASGRNIEKPPLDPLAIRLIAPVQGTGVSFRVEPYGKPALAFQTIVEVGRYLEANRYDKVANKGDYPTDIPIWIKPDNAVIVDHRINLQNLCMRLGYSNLTIIKASPQ